MNLSTILGLVQRLTLSLQQKYRSARATSTIAFVFFSNVQGVWVQRGTFSSLKPITLEEWSKSDGEARAEAMGASVDVGDGYASNFLVVNPQEKLTEGDKKFSVTMKVDSSMSGTVTVYKADANSPQWRKVDADIDDGVAKMQVDSGMCY